MNTEKPEIVKKAQVILWATLGIGIVRSAMEFTRMSQQATAVGGGWFVHFVTLFTFAFIALLIYQLGERKNWARWLYVVLFVLGTPLSISPLLQSLQHEPISGILGLIQVVAQIVAGVFLFLAPARAWYKKQPQQITN